MTSAGWRSWRWTGLIGSAALGLLGIAGAAQAEGRNPLKIPEAQYEPTTWAAMDGWADDDHDAAFAAFLISCKAIVRGGSEAGRPLRAALYKVCLKAVDATPQKPGEARAFFEKNFRPVRISPLGTPEGFLTGYYEPIVEGTREQANGYEHPLYRRPPNLSGGRMQVPSASGGKKKVRKRKSVPFHDRAAIDDGILAGRGLEICWLKDPIDSFFAHIQGSVRVLLDDGKLMRLNYSAANGHAYYAVGRWLIERNIVAKEEMSMDRIRQWMERNPDEGKELRRRNKSYVFFRETSLSNDQEPIGAQGISLTPGRSIAVDHKLHVYGTPFFISSMLPIESEKPETPFRSLMIAQDTGGAIVGPARADIYFGAGDEAGSVSGRLRHDGRFVMLVPKALGPATAADDDEIPLPRTRPPNLVSDGLTPEQTAALNPEPAKPDAKTPAAAVAKDAAKPADKPAKTASRNAEPKPEKPAKKIEKVTDGKKPGKKPKQKAEKQAEKKKPEKTAGKSTPSKLEAWESRVMPVISSDTPAAMPKSKKKG
ncbi:MAG: lytic transglycosylase [Xanthobacteraceae bacterium]|nr:lytic transglycosylase [Xanthobacteraceae bacterium]